MERVADPLAIAARRNGARSETIAFLLMLAVIVVAPFFVYPVFLMKVLCFALFACAFNLLIGYGGLLSFGHALFFGWASYVAAHMAKIGVISLPYPAGWRLWGWLVIPLPPLSPELAILLGTAAAALLGLLAGWLAIRRQGIYFAMITLALAQMMFFFALQAKFTGGEDGIQAIPRGRLLGLIDLNDQRAMYGFVAVVFVGGLPPLLPRQPSPVCGGGQGVPGDKGRVDSLRPHNKPLKTDGLLVPARASLA